MTTLNTPAAAAPAKALLGTKLGMTQIWDENGVLRPVTVVRVDTNVVTQVRTIETDGYEAVQLAFGDIDASKVTKPLAGHFAKAGVEPRRHVAEIRTSLASEFTPGQELAGDRCHEAPRLRRCGRLPRCSPQPPQAGLHRRLRHPRAHLQGPAHGRSYGPRAPHRPEPQDPRHRR